MKDFKTEVLFCNALQSPLGQVSSVGTIRESVGVPSFPMRILGDYAIVYLVSGNGFYADENGLSCEVRSGDLLLISPDIAHSYGPRKGEIWNEFYAVFSGAIFDFWRQNGLWNETVLHLEPVDFWLKRLQNIKEMARETPNAETALRQICALQSFLADAFAAAHSASQMSSQDAIWLSQARALLNSSTRLNDESIGNDSANDDSSGNDLRDDDSSGNDLRGNNSRSNDLLQEVARQMNVSYESFRKKFAMLAGTSPGNYRAARRWDRACEMLCETNLRQREIAHQLGFCDPYHFSSGFKKAVGCSPQEFRRRWPQVRKPSA